MPEKMPRKSNEIAPKWFTNWLALAPPPATLSARLVGKWPSFAHEMLITPRKDGDFPWLRSDP